MSDNQPVRVYVNQIENLIIFWNKDRTLSWKTILLYYLKKLISKYSQKHLNHAKQSAADALKTTSKRTIQNTVEATSDFIGNKIADTITKVSKVLSHNNSETDKSETENTAFVRKIPKERYTFPE